ncbi:hypothetical protein AAVH_43489, partial [Aphelenchoides avenae]
VQSLLQADVQALSTFETREKADPGKTRPPRLQRSDRSLLAQFSDAEQRALRGWPEVVSVLIDGVLFEGATTDASDREWQGEDHFSLSEEGLILEVVSEPHEVQEDCNEAGTDSSIQSVRNVVAVAITAIVFMMVVVYLSHTR